MLKELLRWRPGQGQDGPPARFEIQVHPNDIRRGVFYLFLSQRQGLWALVGIGGYLLFMVFSAAVAPGVISSRLSARKYQELLGEREAEGSRLVPQVAELEELSDRASDLRLTLDRVFLAYGLQVDEATGLGGYPFQAEPVPASIRRGAYGRTVDEGRRLGSGVEEQLRVVDRLAQEVHELDRAKRELTLTTPSICPLQRDRFVLTSPFGNRRNPFTNAPDFHAGVDLAALEGTPVFAPADAQVVFAGRYPLNRSHAWWQYGNLVVLKHRDDLITLYGHCQQVLVKRGQKVRRGDRIALVGDTGHSTNPHLHYEVRRRNEAGRLAPVDPRIYMLDLELSDQEKVLIARRSGPSYNDFEPLPKLIANDS
jgi:murein DD-endopeptidase MepM/ murein hydrolase activator NlpD